MNGFQYSFGRDTGDFIIVPLIIWQRYRDGRYIDTCLTSHQRQVYIATEQRWCCIPLLLY